MRQQLADLMVRRGTVVIVMENKPPTYDQLDPATVAVYGRAIDALIAAKVAFLAGGAYALDHFTGIQRHTKDLDLFVRPERCQKALDTLAQAGFRTELTFPHWLGKAYEDDLFIDVIFSSGNGIVRVDDGWFEYAVPMELLGRKVLGIPAEEMIWSKSYIMERERYDGADIAHLLRAQGDRLNWPRLLGRYGEHWPVLLNHLLLFRFVYPSERDKVPSAVMSVLLDRATRSLRDRTPASKVCRGTLLSREQYLPDIKEWGYKDARLKPEGTMNAADLKRWTDAIATK